LIAKGYLCVAQNNNFNQINLSAMIQQKIQTQLKNILNSFLAGEYANVSTLFDTVARTVDGAELSENDMSQLSKLLSIFL
jgi:hypothetical protein